MNFPAAYPPIYCTKCGGKLHETIVEIKGRTYNAYTGQIESKGKATYSRMCFTIPITLPYHPSWSYTEGDSEWVQRRIL